MAWVKLDDKMDGHPKVVSVGLEAFGLYVASLTYSARNLTDGHIPSAWPKEKAGTRAKRLVALLLEERLWEENGKGYIVHDFLDHNPSKENVLSKRRSDSARKAGGK